MSIDNKRPDSHPGKIFPLATAFGDVGKGTVAYYQVHSIRQHKDGTKVLVSEALEKGFYAMPLKPDPGADRVFAALMQDYMAGRIGDLTDARLENLGPAPHQKAQPLFEAATAVEGKGIYVGIWEPQNERGQVAIFDIYAAPEDVKDGSGARLQANFNVAASYLAELKDFHGYNGGPLCCERDLPDKAFSDPAALSQWFIPTRNFLFTMHDLRDKGAFDGSFSQGGGMLTGRDWYHGSKNWYSYGLDFGAEDVRCYVDKYSKKGYLRPVRAELRQGTPAAGPA